MKINLNFLKLKFRDTMDMWHYYGSGSLAFILFYFGMPFLWCLAIVNFLGLLNEFLEWKAYTHYSDPMWKENAFMKMLSYVFSGDHKWDWIDLKLNLMGSTMVLPYITLWLDAFNKKENKNEQEQESTK